MGAATHTLTVLHKDVEEHFSVVLGVLLDTMTGHYVWTAHFLHQLNLPLEDFVRHLVLGAEHGVRGQHDLTTPLDVRPQPSSSVQTFLLWPNCVRDTQNRIHLTASQGGGGKACEQCRGPHVRTLCDLLINHDPAAVHGHNPAYEIIWWKALRRLIRNIAHGSRDSESSCVLLSSFQQYQTCSPTVLAPIAAGNRRRPTGV